MADGDGGRAGNGNAFPENGDMNGALHTAARSGSVANVEFLLRQKADVNAKDADGFTALDVAEAMGKLDVVEILFLQGGFGPASPQQGFNPMSQTAPGQGFGDEPDEGMKKDSMSRSMPALGSYEDMKRKTNFPGASTDGVLKRTTYMTACSGFPSAPKFSLGQRGPNLFVRPNQTPAPGTYNLPPDDKSKYKMMARYSFGGGSRFGLEDNPTKKAPGPGQYNPFDPNLHADTKIGFGTAERGRGNLMAQANPGPGAYEFRTCMGAGLMFSAAGRRNENFARARSMPGPGAYQPMYNSSSYQTPKPGFGTSTRGGASVDLGKPGPGTYELQNFKAVGTDAPKFSATSRRKVHDIESYVTPGPGSYNGHTTSFGPGS